MEKKDIAVGGIALGAGLLIGAIIALLYAPQSGQETRKMIVDKAGEVKDKITEKLK
jgi:gas vesicle protein